MPRTGLAHQKIVRQNNRATKSVWPKHDHLPAL